MRKTTPMLLILLLGLFLCTAACADTYVVDNIYASVEIPVSFPVVLRSERLSEYEQWLSSQGKNLEDVTNDFLQRGVQMQCWNEAGDLCFELTATQTDQTRLIFDVNEQSTSVRASYRLGHYPRNDYAAQGYDFSSANWKNTADGRFLVLKYNKRDMGEVLHRGFMRRTIRNGYEITLDMQVHGRAVTNKDNAELEKIWKSFHFIEVQPMPPSASAQVNITTAPPEETNQSSFTMEGTAASGVKLTAVIMGLSYPDPVLYEVTVDASGKFKLPVTLPKEGVFLMTVTGEYQGEDVLELAYPVTYQRTLLTVNVATVIPQVLTSSDLSITGTAEPGANIQVFLNSEAVLQKKVTAAGKFKLDLKIQEEGPWELVLTFSKKNLADRRLTYNLTRKWTDEDTLKRLRTEAIKPGYSTLVNKMSGYEGRIMGYRAYLLGVNQSGEDWIAEMALTKNGQSYSGIILVVCHEEPSFPVGERVMMYGTCAGMSVSMTADGEAGLADASYPCFELLLFASLD